MLVSSGDNIMTSSHLVLHNSLVLLAFNHAVVKEAGFMDNIDKCFQSSVVYWKTKALLYDEERCFSQTRVSNFGLPLYFLSICMHKGNLISISIYAVLRRHGVQLIIEM